MNGMNLHSKATQLPLDPVPYPFVISSSSTTASYLEISVDTQTPLHIQQQVYL